MVKDNITLSKKLEINLVNYFSNIFKNKEKVNNLVNLFKNNISKLAKCIQTSIKEKNEEKVLRNLHSLKGVFNSAYLTEQGKLIETIENNLKKEQNLNLMEKEFKKFLESLKS